MNVSLEDIHGILRDPDRPFAFFPGGCPAPLREGIEFGELCGACPIQAAGTARAKDVFFRFRARHGQWSMEIGPAPVRSFSGDDPWAGWMPPSVAFALITSKLLWHVCGGDRRSEQPWPGLRDFSVEHLVDLHAWLCFHDDWQANDLRRMHNAVLVEAERRQWPEGWWEDPSVVLEIR